MHGYIKIDRSILNHPALTKRGKTYCELGAWVWLLLEASFVKRDFQIGSATITLDRGQLCHSVSYMSKAWGWKDGKVKSYLDKLVKFNSISMHRPKLQSADVPNILVILNYNHYQDPLVQSVRQPKVGSQLEKHNKIIIKEDKYIGDFNNIWNKLLAKRGSKKNAYKKYLTLRDKIDPDTVVACYNKLVSETKEVQFVPHFVTWLNGERWEDENSIKKAPTMTHDQHFRSQFNVPSGYSFIGNTWNEIEYSNGKQYIKFNLRTGEKI